MKQKLQELRRLLSVYAHVNDRPGSKSAFRSSILSKIKSLIAELQAYSLSHVKHAVAAALLIIGAGKVSAQSFKPVAIDTFNLELDTAKFSMLSMVDIDNDGDLDLFSGSYESPILYFENIGSATAPNFTTPVANPFGLSLPANTYMQMYSFGDLDNDGDYDIMTSGDYLSYGGIIFWENVGTASAPSFTSPVSDPFGAVSVDSAYINVPALADLDNDGDLDILSSIYDNNYNTEFVYYENIGTASAPNFAAPVDDPFNLDNQIAEWAAPILVDLDLDGDYDIVAGVLETYGVIAYFENVGTAASPSFGNIQSNPFNLTSVEYFAFPASGDLDNDGDIDLMVGEYYESGVARFHYFENDSINVSISELSENNIRIYPSPAKDFIAFELDFIPESVLLIDATGQTVQMVSPMMKGQIDLTELPSGIYFVRVSTSNQTLTKRVVKL